MFYCKMDCKDSEKREQSKIYFQIAEVHPIFYKSSTKMVQVAGKTKLSTDFTG